MELYRVGQLRRRGKRSRIRNFELRRFNVDDTPRAETRASTNWPGNTKFVRELYAYVTRRLSFHRLPLPVSTRDNIILRVTAPQASRQREERISYYEKGVGTPPSLPSLSRLSMAWSASYRKTPLPIPSSFYDFRERIIHAERHGRLYTGRKLNHEFVRFVRKVCRDRMGWERMH